MKPALRKRHWTSRSSGHAFFTADIHAPDGSERSAFTLTMLRAGNSARSSFTVASKTGSSRASAITSSSCARSARASSLPMPLDAPVTSAHFASYFFFRFCVPSATGISVLSTK